MDKKLPLNEHFLMQMYDIKQNLLYGIVLSKTEVNRQWKNVPKDFDYNKGMVVAFAHHIEHWLFSPATLCLFSTLIFEWLKQSLQHRDVDQGCKLISCNYTAGIPLN